MAKKARKSATSSKSKSDWRTELVQTFRKHLKSGSARLVVLSQYGDLLLSSHNDLKVDTTSLGSLLSSLDGACRSTATLLKVKASRIQTEGFWLERIHDHALLLGVKCAPSDQVVAATKKSLKHLLSATSSSSHEALEGLTPAGVDGVWK